MIGIIGAMEEEVATLKEQMKVEEIVERASMKFYSGTLCKKNVVIVRSGIGKVNAAVCAQILIDKFQGGPVGLETLAAALGEDSGTLEDVYEPYLVKNGFLNRTPRGRVATEEAYIHMGIPISDDK